MPKEVNNSLIARYERKFLVNALTRQEIETIIHLHPDIFTEVFPPRNVNNIYLDSHYLKFYFDNVNGVRDRLKVRIRWYGKLFGLIEEPVLELKIKNALLGRKKSYPLIPFAVDNEFSFKTLSKIFEKSKLPEALKYELYCLQPMLLNRYRRKYLISANKNFRITIDFNQEFYQLRKHNNTFCNKYADNFSTIVELKYPQDQDSFADTVSNFFPFRLTKNSKYVNGLDRLNLL